MNKTTATKGKILFIGLGLCYATAIKPQTNNAMYPNTLRLETACGLDTGVSKLVNNPQLGQVYYYQVIDGFDLQKSFIDLAKTDSSRVLDVNKRKESTYPYDFKGLKRPNQIEIRDCLGEERMKGKNQNGQVLQFIKAIDIKEYRAVHFLEDWELDTINNQFRKKIQGIVPLRVVKGHLDQPQLRKTCLLVNGKGDTSPKKLVARVKFEVLLFNPFYAKIAESELPYFSKNDLLTKHEQNDAPFFSSYSRYVLTRFLWDRAISGKIRSYDFETNSLIANKEELKRLLGYIENVVEVRNVVDNTVSKMKMGDNTGTIKSVVFCEEWYYQPATASYSKEVIGIVPVLWDNATDRKTPCFTMWLDEKRMF